MPTHDLDDILNRIDLEALADQLCGPHRGHGSGARWPSPVPDHPQTGKTPPMSIFTDRRGRQRWTCWATGTSGTAIDLVTVSRRMSVADAIHWLADRAGSEPTRPVPKPRPQAPRRTGPSDALREYVRACVEQLRKPSGAVARDWLADRQLSPDVLDLNEVGYDPGQSRLRRPRGLPFRGPGIVLPTFDRKGSLVYAQTRYLDVEDAGRKYDNPSSGHATKPPLSWPRMLCDDGECTVICEGVIDALTVAGIRIRSVALLSAGDAGHGLGELTVLDGRVVIATDPDEAGRAAADSLRRSLAESGMKMVHQLNLPADVNDFARRLGDRFEEQFRSTVRELAVKPENSASLGR